MLKPVRRWKNFVTAKFRRLLNKSSDPRFQLECAIQEAQDQHGRLKEVATAVMAGQRQSEILLEAKLAEQDTLCMNVRRALVTASTAKRAGDAGRSATFGDAAARLAVRLVQVERDVEGLESMVLQTSAAADRAKDAVKQSSRAFQHKLTDASKRVSRLEQAKLQEEMNAAMVQLNEAVGEDVPTLEEVEVWIKARSATANAPVEPESSEQPVGEMTADVEARLDELRSQLGLDGD